MQEKSVFTTNIKIKKSIPSKDRGAKNPNSMAAYVDSLFSGLLPLHAVGIYFVKQYS